MNERPSDPCWDREAVFPIGLQWNKDTPTSHEACAFQELTRLRLVLMSTSERHKHENPTAVPRFRATPSALLDLHELAQPTWRELKRSDHWHETIRQDHCLLQLAIAIGLERTRPHLLLVRAALDQQSATAW